MRNFYSAGGFLLLFIKNLSKLIIMDFKKKILLIVVGSVTGVLNGFFGGGGGMVVVPILTLILAYKPKEAHSTAILIMLPITVVSTVVYLIKNSIDFSKFLPVTIGVFVGGIIGAFLLKKINSKVLTKIFAVVMLLAGGKMLFF